MGPRGVEADPHERLHHLAEGRTARATPAVERLPKRRCDHTAAMLTEALARARILRETQAWRQALRE